MEKDRVSSLLKAGGWLDIAAFALTVLLAALTIFSIALMQRGLVSDTAYDAGEAFMAAGIVSFVFVMVVLAESGVLALLFALGGVGLVFGIRALRAAKRGPARVPDSTRAFPVFTMIQLILFALAGGLCCIPASEWYALLAVLFCLVAVLGCLAASLAVKLACRARLKRQAAGCIGVNAEGLREFSDEMR